MRPNRRAISPAAPSRPSEKILHSWAYPLPHRGATLGDGNGWSRLTDGDLKSYWKSNPYLTKAYTGEDDSLHPQWVMIDLGAKVDVNAIKIAWADPYARRYYVQFWTGEQEPFYDGINKGTWQTFPMGTVADGKGGTPTLKLMNWKIPVRYLRIWMTESSNTCDTHGAQDKRNCVGYAINELYIGTVSADGQFTDIVKHLPSRQQTITWPSSVDPWHAASDLDYGRGDQIGFDFFFNCGVTRGLPAMIPIAILYAIPEDAANEIAYLYKRKYPISWIEMGEEADGQRVLPEDYATLYIQFAKAIHKLVPNAPAGRAGFRGNARRRGFLGGRQRKGLLPRPVRGLSEGARPPAGFHVLLFRALSLHGQPAVRRLEFPVLGAGVCEPRDSGLEGQRAAAERAVLHDRRQRPRRGRSRAPSRARLWLADYVGSMLTAGAGGTYYFHYIASAGRGGGGGGFLPIDENNHVRNYPPQYLATQVITKEWVQPVDAIHKLFKVCERREGQGREHPGHGVRRRAARRAMVRHAGQQGSGQRPLREGDVRRSRRQAGPVLLRHGGPRGLRRRPNTSGIPIPLLPVAPPAGRGGRGGGGRGGSGHADPDGPPSKSTVTAGGPDTLYQLPKASIIVLRGKLTN